MESSGPWARSLRVQYLRLYIIAVNTKEVYKYNTPIRHTHVSSPRDFIRFIESGKISNSNLFFIIYSSLGPKYFNYFTFHGDIGNKAGASERIEKPVNCLSKIPETYIKLESPDSNLGPGVIQDVPL